MNPLDFLNQNPALTSIVAFPVGLVLLLGVLKLVGLDPKDFLKALKDHTEAEIKIESKLTEFVSQVKALIEDNHTYRNYIDTHLEEFSVQLVEILNLLHNIIRIVPKRKGDDWPLDEHAERRANT